MSARAIWAVASLLLLQASATAIAADKRYPDWPCHQIKVPELSVAAIWPKPLAGTANNPLAEMPGVAALLAELAARRTPMEQAEKKISAFVTGTPEEKDAKASFLFGRLFEALNIERSQVMNGIERAYRRQKHFAGKIRADMTALRALQDANGDEARLQDTLRQVEWETRVFDERRKTLTYACEVPVAIDQRLFALARDIQKATGVQ